jgi:hypothetical protein
MLRSLIFTSCLLIYSCSNETNENNLSELTTSERLKQSKNTNTTNSTNKKNQRLQSLDSLIDVRELNAGIKVDLKYTSRDNFMNMRL